MPASSFLFTSPNEKDVTVKQGYLSTYDDNYPQCYEAFMSMGKKLSCSILQRLATIEDLPDFDGDIPDTVKVLVS